MDHYMLGQVALTAHPIFVKYNKYSPHLIETMDSKPRSLATASILGQPPS
jgi:hypothetical protein